MMGQAKYFFICNPAANTGRLRKRWDKIHKKITEFLQEEDYTWQFTRAPLHAMDLAKQAAESGYTHVISVGGDGVANEILNALMQMEQKPIFGILPAGTSNDAHITHQFPNDPIKALPLLFENKVEKFAVGKVEGDFSDKPHYFLDHCDCGLSSMAARSAKYGSKLLKGEWKYTYYALKNLVRFKRNPGRVTIDGETFEEEFCVVAAGFGDSMSGYNLWPDNHNRMGDFGITLAYGQSRFQLLKLMLAAEKGKHIGREGVEYLRGKKVEIELTNAWPFQAEGEIFSEGSTNVTFTYVKDALDMVTNIG